MTVQPIAGAAVKVPEPSARTPGATAADRLASAVAAALDRLGERVVLFRAGDWVFVSFGLFATVGAWLTMAMTGCLLTGQGVAAAEFLRLTLAGSAAVVGGSWLLARLLDLRASAADRAAEPPRPAFVSWGGLFPLLLLLFVFGAVSGHGELLVLDALARSIPLGHAVGRLGCLSYGCCFGRPTTGRLAITYHAPEAKAVRVGARCGVPLHPAPLYEAILDLALFAAANATAWAGAPSGSATALVLLGYGCGRFAIEFLRDDGESPVSGRITMNQRVALAAALVGAALAGGVLLGEPVAPPAFAWSAPLREAPWLAAATIPGALTVFFGFSLHRGEVGRW